MNVRFAPQTLRCRVTKAELDRLLLGRAIELQVPLPRGNAFRTSVNSGTVGDWRLESDPTGIWITIPKAELTAFAATLPNQDGLEHDFAAEANSLHLCFEVDVRE